MDSGETQDMAMNRSDIITLLESKVCEVRFTKVSGEERVMPCTLKRDVVPPAKAEDPASQKRVREVNPNVIVAYCTDKQAWRSFRVDNVISIKEVSDAL